MNVFKLLNILQKGNKSLFDIPIEKQKDFLVKLGHPVDDIDRSYKQYLSQNLFVPKYKVLLLNIVFAFIYPFQIIYLLSKGLFIRQKRYIECLASLKLSENFFSQELLKEFKEVNDSVWGRKYSLRLYDFPFIIKIIKKGFKHPYFISKSIILLSSYSDMIYRFSPKALLAHCEYSFTSSLLTSYCDKMHVEHINTMHGEKLFYIRDAFVHFHRFFVWDKHYVDLFMEMGAEHSQFKIFIPKRLCFECSEYENKLKFTDYKYYLTVYNEEQLKQIVKSMNSIQKSGNSIKYRPHPRYSNMILLRKYVSDEFIEDSEVVSIEESISNSNYVIGSYTTVLNQAYYVGKHVVLDNVAYHDEFLKMKKLKYILANMNCMTLTSLINELQK